jgi:type I restriction enzyme, S subunit
VSDCSERRELGHPEPLPLVVFGDHTRAVKFVDFSFLQGADGAKVLKALPETDLRYGYYALQALTLPNEGYSQHIKFPRRFYFPWCDRPEQRAFVARIETAFAALDRVEAEARAAERALDWLDQAILANAFRGELVPHDPADEPASALLARIAAERATAPKPARGRRKASVA